MSRSNPTAKNPAERFIQWRGGAENVGSKIDPTWEGGKLTYYDRDTEKEVEIKLPFSFLVLDELSTITGYSEPQRSGFWSNEVRSLTTDPFIVKNKAGVVATGLYGTISDRIKSEGAKYAKSVYIAFKNDEGELAIGNIKIAGAALNAWIEFQKKFNVMECAVYISDEPKLEKKGSNHYFSPVFEGQKASTESAKAATALDEVLQNYLGNYLSRKSDIDEAVPVAQDDVEIEDLPDKEEESADEAEPVAEPAKQSKASKETQGDDSIPLADVPF